jgi:hypothetical protein
MIVRGSHVVFFYLISRLVLFSKSKSVLYDTQPIYGSYRVFLKTQLDSVVYKLHKYLARITVFGVSGFRGLISIVYKK